jgi:hypothetical protein
MKPTSFGGLETRAAFRSAFYISTAAGPWKSVEVCLGRLIARNRDAAGLKEL